MKFDQHARFCLTMIIIYIIFIGACVYTERAYSSENVLEFDTWQVTIQQDGWPKLRYLNYATMTSYVLGYMASTSCADVKFEYRRFIEKDIDSLKSAKQFVHSWGDRPDQEVKWTILGDDDAIEEDTPIVPNEAIYKKDIPWSKD